MYPDKQVTIVSKPEWPDPFDSVYIVRPKDMWTKIIVKIDSISDQVFSSNLINRTLNVQNLFYRKF